jgi:hypothetical protein
MTTKEAEADRPRISRPAVEGHEQEIGPLGVHAFFHAAHHRLAAPADQIDTIAVEAFHGTGNQYGPFGDLRTHPVIGGR